jgi:hypothetical protein
MPKKKVNSLFLLVLSLFPLFLMGGGLFFITRSSGFSIDKIMSTLIYNHTWEIDPLSELQREMLIQKVFPQTYYYLAAGNQCYAFISEDRQYVLKFFKMQNLFPKGWLNSFPLSLFQKIGFKSESGNQFFSERIFASYKDAYQFLRDETGLVYIHLNKSCEFNSKVTLIDSKGKKHLLELDKVEFVVQKRAQKIFEHLNELVEQDKYEELRTSIRSFLQLIAGRCEKGFVDQDLSIRNNFGFVGNDAIQFDCATLTRDSSMKYPLNFRHEVMQVAERLDLWAAENNPEITLFIQEEAQRIINHSF